MSQISPFSKDNLPARADTMASGLMAREAQEAQAAMVVAKLYPRDATEATIRILKNCQRLSLAEVAMYEYPRGGTRITGPSIRLAEMFAQNWGNIDCGVKVLEQDDGVSKVMAYAHDLETNYRNVKIFTVRHERAAHGKTTVLTDARDVYEMVANQGARRLRACILAVIPGDVQEQAVTACQKTMMDGGGVPIGDRIIACALAFEQQFNISREMLEAKLGHNLDATDETELVRLRTIFQSLRDGMSKREDWFEVASDSTNPDDLTAGEKQTGKPKAKKAKKSAKKAEAPTEPPVPEAEADAPTTQEDWNYLSQAAKLALSSISADMTDGNIERVYSAAAISIAEMTHGQVSEAGKRIAALTQEQIESALE